MKGYRKYFTTKLVWFLTTFVFAFLLNFILPRMMPGDPVAVITQRVTQGMTCQSGAQAVYQQYNDDRSQTAISVVTLLTGQSRTLVPPVTGVYVEQPDWQPALGCRPWPFPSVN